jgi:hypothetical protein
MPRDVKILFLIGAVIVFMLIIFLTALFTSPTPSPVTSPSPTPISSIFRGIDPGNIVNPNYVQPSITPYTPQNDYSSEYTQKAKQVENNEKAEREKGESRPVLASIPTGYVVLRASSKQD